MLANVVSTVVKPYLYGKHRERLIEACDTMQARLAGTDTICDTRFMASEVKVLSHLLQNIPVSRKPLLKSRIHFTTHLLLRLIAASCAT